MNVYRLCDQEEVEKIITTKSFQEVGKEGQRNPYLNNHSYEPHIKYLHFFQSFSSLFYFNLSEDSYVCTYDIAKELLEKHKGIGKYLDRMFMRKHERVTEYAIPSQELSFTDLKKVERVTEWLDYEDCLAGNYYDRLETVYDRDQKPYVFQKK
ncbi:MAG: hypothetical protein J6X28_00585 [Bacilli bacterium]|nr:hypothetical protein [Bacilli bacterium]